jgi:hypothetical protein
MIEAVYVLCTLASIACCVLLLRGHRVRKTRLLFWSSLCFAGLALNSLLVLVDLLVVPGVDLTLPRIFTPLISMALLVYGLIWEAR